MFLKNVLNKINSSKNLQKLPQQFPAVREGSFCKFLDELILASTFLRKTDFNQKYGMDSNPLPLFSLHNIVCDIKSIILFDLSLFTAFELPQ